MKKIYTFLILTLSFVFGYSQTYNITLEVNTANIYNNGGSVGPNGMYAGGGFIGDAQGLQLTQSTTDTMIWSGVVAFDGSAGIHYTFLNSPGWGGDWGTKENLAGLPCGDPNNYNDRLLPVVAGDTTIKHCFGTCDSDGSCPAPPASFIDITFTLNVSSITSAGGSIDPTGMFIAGGGNFGNPGDNPMTDLGGGVWSITVNKPVGFTSDYTFTNGNSGWGAKENISGLSCAVPPYSDRNLAPVYSDTTIQHCFGTCDYDGSCASAVTPPNYTFQVDMNQSGYGTTAVPYLRGSWDWGGSGDMMADADGDGVWEVTKSITGGAEYLFAVDTDGVGGWDVNESNDPNEPCTNGNATYTNRVLTIATADTTLGVVCLGSCSPCVAAGPPCPHTFNMYDSWGDGWNGGSVDVLVNGTTVLTGATCTGAFTAATFNAGSGDLIELANWNPGSYPSEITWDVTDGFGNIIGSGNTTITAVGTGNCPSCFTPTALAVTNVTTTGADFGWTAGGTETAWNVEYGPAGFTLGSGTLVNVTTNPYTLSGLMSATGYDVYVQADCGGGDVSPWSAAVSFATQVACGDNVGPICYGPGNTQVFTAQVSNPGDFITVTVSQGNTEAGYDYLQMYDSYNSTTGTQLYNADGDHTGVAITSSTGSITVFIDGDGSWNCQDGSGGPYTPLQFAVTCSAPPSCVDPIALMAGNVTSSSADLSWTALGTETAWNIQYGAAGFTPGSGTVVNVTTNPYTLTGLTAQTSYDYWVQADCGGGTTSAYVGPYTFTTQCAAVTAPYTQDFAAGLPTCWDENQTTGSGWVFSGTPGYTAAGNGRASGTYAWIDFSGTDVGAVLHAVPVDISGLTTPELAFDYFSDQGTYTVTPANIMYIEANNGSAWVTIDSIQDATTPGWNTYSYDITGYDVSGLVSLRFRAESGGASNDFYNDILLDDFIVREMPSCTQPTALGSSNITAASADLGWTAGGTETAWNIEYDTAGFVPGTGTVVAITSNPYTLTGLTAQTSYDYWVQADCGNGDVSPWSGPHTFATACGTFTAPFLDNFDAGIPCWTQDQNDVFDWTLDANGTTSSSTGPSDDITGGGNYLYIETSTPRTTGDSAMIHSGDIDLSGLTNPQLRFFSHMYGASTGELSVWITDASGSMTQVFIKTGDQGNQWNEELVSLAGYSGVVHFTVLGVVSDNGAGTSYWGDIAFDNFEVREEPSCYDPTGVSTVSVSSDSATITWSADPSVTTWNYVLGAAGFDPLTGTPVSVTSTTLVLSGLTPASNYDFYVQSDCGTNGVSNWVGPLSFSTGFPAGYGCPHTINLIDSYGDGWNGGSVDVSVNGVVVLAGAACTGSFDAVPFNAGTGDIISTSNWVPGSWPGEISWEILDGGGAIIAAGVVNVDTSVAGNCPACLPPTALTASNITTNSADLAWTAGGTETQWNIQYGAAGFAPGTGTIVNVSTNPYTLTGLTAATPYDYWVQAVCGSDSSSYAGPFTFGTSCNASLAPTNETFDAGFSVCWSQDGNDDFDWSVDALGTPSGGTGPSDDFTGGGNYMYTEASLPRAHGDVATMYSEVIDISGLTNPELRFLNHMYGTAIGTLSVDLWDASTGTNLATVFTHSGDRGNQWNEELIMLSTTATNVQFSITAVLDTNAAGQAWPGDIAIDEFGVREAAANDIAVVAGAVPSGCDLTSAENIEIWVVNQGLVAENQFDVSYAVNGGTPVVESNTLTVNPGDTLKYIFAATADMSADGMYNVDFAAILATDNDPADNALSSDGENYYTPMAPMTDGDTICNGDTAMVYSDADYTYWYDAATGGNLVGEGDLLDVSPSATTSYYAEAVAVEGYFEDFDSYNDGDFIVVVDPDNWAVWPGGTPGGLYDAPVSSAQASSGTNSLWLNNASTHDPVLEFGEAFSTGKFYYAMDMYIVTSAYFNFQEDVNIGTAWNMSVFFTGGVIDIQVDGASVLTGAYSTTPTGGPVWFNIELECDFASGVWEVFVNGNSQGTFVNPDPVASCNLYANTGDDYYIDNVEWGALKADACTSASRTEAVVTVEDCSNINELSFKDLSIYPNPNNGQFTITNSQEMTEVIITDLQGKVIYNNTNINLNKVNVELSELERGMYMINIKTVDGRITKTITVQ
jgi:hypothetical protein